MATPSYPAAPLGARPPADLRDAASISWLRQIVEVANRILRGKTNNVLVVTLTASSTTTTVTDARIGPYSALLMAPTTANAAAAMTALYASAQSDGSATLTHDSTADVDRIFNMAIVG